MLQPIERSMQDPNQPLVAWNADPSFYSTPAPITCHDLDQVSATRPILVTNASGHILYANSKVLQLIFQAVKFTADGSIQGFTARLRPPYYTTGANGLWNRSPEELSALVGTMHAAGYQVACHCNGDQAAEAFIDAVAAAQAAKPRFDHRHFIVHGQMLDALKLVTINAAWLLTWTAARRRCSMPSCAAATAGAWRCWSTTLAASTSTPT